MSDNKLLNAAKAARHNISSLMAAYPDLYPRHAFQGTFDLLDEAIRENVGTSAQQPTLFDRAND